MSGEADCLRASLLPPVALFRDASLAATGGTLGCALRCAFESRKNWAGYQVGLEEHEEGPFFQKLIPLVVITATPPTSIVFVLYHRVRGEAIDWMGGLMLAQAASYGEWT